MEPEENKPIETPETETPEQVAFEIPAEYKDKAWANQIHSIEDAFKKIDNQEKYISKGQLPHKDSSESDLENFSEKMKKYTSEIDYTDLVGNDEELGKALRESGVPKFQAKAVVELVKGRQAKEYGVDEFNKILMEKFKGRESDLVMAKSVLREMGEEKANSLLGKRNDVVADVMDILAEVGKKYEVKQPTTMAKLSESPLGSQPAKTYDMKDPETRRAYVKELEQWYKDPHASEDGRRKIQKKYGIID